MTNQKDKNMLQLYSILEIKEHKYGRPMCFSNDQQAKQETLKHFLLQDPKEELNPKNFELHYLGEFDDYEGYITKTDAHCICKISDIVKTEKDKTLQTLRNLKVEISTTQAELNTLNIEKNALVNNQLQKEQSK